MEFLGRIFWEKEPENGGMEEQFDKFQDPPAPPPIPAETKFDLSDAKTDGKNNDSEKDFEDLRQPPEIPPALSEINDKKKEPSDETKKVLQELKEIKEQKIAEEKKMMEEAKSSIAAEPKEIKPKIPEPNPAIIRTPGAEIPGLQAAEELKSRLGKEMYDVDTTIARKDLRKAEKEKLEKRLKKVDEFLSLANRIKSMEMPIANKKIYEKNLERAKKLRNKLMKIEETLANPDKPTGFFAKLKSFFSKKEKTIPVNEEYKKEEIENKEENKRQAA